MSTVSQASCKVLGVVSERIHRCNLQRIVLSWTLSLTLWLWLIVARTKDFIELFKGTHSFKKMKCLQMYMYLPIKSAICTSTAYLLQSNPAITGTLLLLFLSSLNDNGHEAMEMSLKILPILGSWYNIWAWGIYIITCYIVTCMKLNFSFQVF